MEMIIEDNAHRRQEGGRRQSRVFLVLLALLQVLYLAAAVYPS